jgi:hypothetical protein
MMLLPFLNALLVGEVPFFWPLTHHSKAQKIDLLEALTSNFEQGNLVLRDK